MDARATARVLALSRAGDERFLRLISLLLTMLASQAEVGPAKVVSVVCDPAIGIVSAGVEKSKARTELLERTRKPDWTSARAADAEVIAV
jgi:hypothetical protein